MATTYDFTYSGSIMGSLPLPETIEKGKIVPVTGVADFDRQSLDAGEADVAQVIHIPAGTEVLYCSVIPAKDANGDLPPANATVDCGYGSGVNQWGSGIVLDTVEHNVATSGGVAPTLAPVYFASADTIDLKATTDDADVNIDTGRAIVTAYCVKY